MRHLTLFITFCLLLWVASSSPINQKRWLINRPSVKEIFALRGRRHAYEYGTKEYRPRMYSSHRQQPLEFNLIKGEYMCRGQVCKLMPGEIPRDCNGVCQYPI
ncbi:uncharacterized protein LOC115448789 [Manduca sexta]|uniref:uncharacterized protein LOC115448789 n=1 Tax=Manduca sexta TaxID=7130 RepID=UPI0018902065|nr:uncharacterized protein LOC115448789 [Manduca sexta]